MLVGVPGSQGFWFGLGFCVVSCKVEKLNEDHKYYSEHLICFFLRGKCWSRLGYQPIISYRGTVIIFFSAWRMPRTIIHTLPNPHLLLAHNLATCGLLPGVVST